MNIPRIVNAIGYIDDDLITAALEDPPRKRHNLMIKWIESGEVNAGDLVVVEYEGEISSNCEVKGAYSIFTGVLEENGILNQE